MAGARRCARRAPMNKYQPACKPGSVRRGACAPHVTAIHLGRRLPGASSNLPGRPDPDTDPGELLPRAAPIRFCSRWGLPCHSRCRERGALLPHRFTLAFPLAGSGGFFSVALSLELLPPDVIRHRMSMEPGLSSRGDLSALPQAAVRPTDLQRCGMARRPRQGRRANRLYAPRADSAVRTRSQ
jgi:hypothetical protein